MQSLFSEWYRLSKVEFNEDILQKRWSGVEAFAKSMDVSSTLELVRLVNKKNIKDASFKDKFCGVFKEADVAFPMSGNKLELEILASAALAHSISKSSKIADTAALAIISSNYIGRAQKLSIAELVLIAQKYIKEKSSNMRSANAASNDISEYSPTKAAAAVKAAAPDLNNTATAIADQVIKPLAKAIVGLDRQVKMQREEANALWWLMGEYSNDEQKPIVDLNLPFACLVVGKELADLSIFLPGFFAIEAFCSKALSCFGQELKDISLKEAINATSTSWKQNAIKDNLFDTVQDLCPVHYGIIKSIEAGQKKDAWVPFVENNMKIKASIKVPAIKLAIQTYSEILLAKSIAEHD